jgi:cytochrome P450
MNPTIYKDGLPLDLFKQLRQECPVSLQRDTHNDMDMWVITKQADIDYISKNPKIFSSAQRLALLDEYDGELLELQRTQIIHKDPPEHVKYRRIVRNAFTARAVESLEPFIRDVAKQIVDHVASRGECEFVSEVSAEMPLLLICELMGMPPKDRKKFSDYVDTMLLFLDPTAGISQEQAQEAMTAVFTTGQELAAEHHANPKENVIASLLDGVVEGEALTDDEFCTFVLLLIVGGIETTRTATSHGMRLLMEHPDQLQMLVDDPSLIPGAVEEILRYNASFLAMRRTAMEDVDVGGMQIKKGDKVVLYYVSANHDEDVFGEDAGVFDVTRVQRMEVAKELRTFGIGQHFCLGTHLARKEMVAMFEEIIPRLRNPKLAAPIHYMQSNFISGIREMKISFDAESA